MPGSQIEARIQNLPAPEPQPDAAPPIQPVQQPIQKTESKPDSPKSKAAKPESSTSASRNEWLIMSLCAVVVLAAEIASAPTLIHLAEKVGFRYIELWFHRGDVRARFWLSWMFPIVLDLYANVSAIVWFRSYPRYSKGTVNTAMVNTFLATVLSVLCSGMLHVIITQHWHMSEATWLVVLVSAIPAAVLGASVHLIAMVVRDAATFPIRLHQVQVQIQEAMAAKSVSAESAAENPEASESAHEIDDEPVAKSKDPALAESPKPPKPNRRRKGKRTHKPTAKPTQPEPKSTPAESSDTKPETSDDVLLPIVAKYVAEFTAKFNRLPGEGKVREHLQTFGHYIGNKRAGQLRDQTQTQTKENN